MHQLNWSQALKNSKQKHLFQTAERITSRSGFGSLSLETILIAIQGNYILDITEQFEGGTKKGYPS